MQSKIVSSVRLGDFIEPKLKLSQRQRRAQQEALQRQQQEAGNGDPAHAVRCEALPDSLACHVPSGSGGQDLLSMIPIVADER